MSLGIWKPEALPQSETDQAVREALKRRGRTVVCVLGRSMYPVLRNGTRVEIQAVAYDEMRTGDLIVFTNGKSLICHRLIRKTSRLCCLKGDTNLWMDPPVLWSQVLGKVTRVIDNDLRIYPLDTPHQRKFSALLAKLSYPYALYYNLLHYLGRCSWWSRGIEWKD